MTPRVKRQMQILLWALSFGDYASPQTSTEVCNATGENRNTRSIDTNGFQFAWSSEWNIDGPESRAQGKNRYCICREVHNDSSKPLYYIWPLAGEFANDGLQSHSIDRVCSLDEDYAKPPAQGPLYYGRKRRTTDTRVWQSVSEYQTGEGGANKSVSESAFTVVGAASETSIRSFLVSVNLHSVFRWYRQYILFVPLPRKQEVVNTHLTFRSEVVKTEAGYSIKNRTLNLSRAPISVLTYVSRPQPSNPKPSPSDAQRDSQTISSLQIGPSPLSIWLRIRFFLRYHLWPIRLPPVQEETFKEEVDSDTTMTTMKPVTTSEQVEIRTPRQAVAVKFNVPVWASNPDEKTRR